MFANFSDLSISPELTWLCLHILRLSILRAFWLKSGGGALGMSLFFTRNSESKGFLVFESRRYAEGRCSSTLFSVMPESYYLRGTPSWSCSELADWLYAELTDSDYLELADSSLDCASLTSSYMTPSCFYSSSSLGDSFSSSFNSSMIGSLLKNDLKLLKDWLRLLGIDWSCSNCWCTLG